MNSNVLQRLIYMIASLFPGSITVRICLDLRPLLILTVLIPSSTPASMVYSRVPSELRSTCLMRGNILTYCAGSDGIRIVL